MSEQRSGPRAPLNIFVNKIMDEQIFMCRATDVSTDGIYLSSLIEPSLDGKKVGVEFALETDGEVMWAVGEVVRKGLRGGARGSGIKFTVLPDAYKGIIQQYVRPEA